MPEDYATKKDIQKLIDRLYGQIPKQFEDDIGDIGHIQTALEMIKGQQKEVLAWQKRLSGVPAKIIMGVSFIGMLIAGLNGMFNLLGH